MSMTNEEIVRRYRESTSPREDVKKMANQNGCKPGDIIDILVREGVDITLPEKPPAPTAAGFTEPNGLADESPKILPAPEDENMAVLHVPGNNDLVKPPKDKSAGKRSVIDWNMGRELYDGGANDREIADAVGCQVKVVANWRHRNGLKSNFSSKVKNPAKTAKAPGENIPAKKVGATAKAVCAYDKETIKSELESIVQHLLYAAGYSFGKYLKSCETKDMYMLMEHLGEIGKIVRALSFEGNADEQAQ